MIVTQTIEVVNAVSSGQCVVLEAIWTGTLAIGFDTLKPGEKAEALDAWASMSRHSSEVPTSGQLNPGARRRVSWLLKIDKFVYLLAMRAA
ncbi:MAG: hypothetical protein WBE50_08045 [Methyloceanibacter sp.]